MTFRTISMLLLALLLCSMLTAQARPPAIPSGYQLVPAIVSISGKGSMFEDHRLFLVDGNSGQVWEYVQETVDKQGNFHSSAFTPVRIGAQ